tara:strand:+ start:728 stop:1999 length:1272 start_codon:yes stop_codon:yes gene_type:complete
MSMIPTPAEKTDLRSLFRNSHFRRIWAAGILTSMMRWLDMLVLGVFTFELTDSAGLVAIALVTRQSPRLFFGIALGALADRFNRKHLWICSLLGLAAVAVSLSLLITSGTVVYWHLLLAVFANGTFWALEFPVRRALLADAVSEEAIGPAVSIDWTTDSLNRMVGPAVGGALFVTVGADGAYLLMSAIFIAATLVAIRLRYTTHKHVTDGAGPLAALTSGLRYARSSKIIVGTLIVTVALNTVFPSYQSMIPVIGKDILGADPVGVGLLSATEGLGAVIAALWIASRTKTRSYPRIYFFGTGLFLLCALGFSRSEEYALSAAVLFIGGFGFSSFATMQTAILMRATAPAMRGRVLGVLSLAIGAGPLGALQVSPLVIAVGEQGALSIVILEALAMLVVAGFIWPVLRKPWQPPTQTSDRERRS